jgi:hypothetical protein
MTNTGEGTVYDELVSNALDLGGGERPDADRERLGTDVLLDVVRHGPVLEALLGEALDRREIEGRLDVSRATSHRFTRWLDERGLAAKRDGRFHLTGKGQTLAEAVLRFERNVATADRLAPLLDCICDDHQELVVEPFADATVTVASPGDPYRPVRRFQSLLADSQTFRGFNAAHVVPPTSEGFADAFADTDVELISLPDVVETVPERVRSAVDRGDLRLRTREALPYGLAVFDDRVGIAGYDETTGAMRVFVDTASAYAREWADRTYAAYRSRSDPIDLDGDD